MRRHFSYQRLLIVVVWAALSPQGALLVQSWTARLLGATGFDTATVAGDFDSGWNQWSDRLATVSKNSAAKNMAATGTAAKGPAARAAATQDNRPQQIHPATAERLSAEQVSARGKLPAAEDVAACRFLGGSPADTRRDLNLPGVVIR
jgi:hypothetical protein